MAASHPEYALEETDEAVPKSKLLASGDKSPQSLSKDSSSPTHLAADRGYATSPPSLQYLSSLACPGQNLGAFHSENPGYDTSWAKGAAARHYSSSESSDAACKPKKEGGLSSPCHAYSDDGQCCEKRVSEVVKGVHAKLRRKLKEVGGHAVPTVPSFYSYTTCYSNITVSVYRK